MLLRKRRFAVQGGTFRAQTGHAAKEELGNQHETDETLDHVDGYGVHADYLEEDHAFSPSSDVYQIVENSEHCQ